MTAGMDFLEQVIFSLRALYDRRGYSRYKMSKFEEYDLYARNKDFLVDRSIITFMDTNGRLMALPHYLGIRALLYHQDMLKKAGIAAPPDSWSQLVAMAANDPVVEQRRKLALEVIGVDGQPDRFALHRDTPCRAARAGMRARMPRRPPGAGRITNGNSWARKTR